MKNIVYLQYVINYYGGWGEIRTHGTLAGPAVFKTAALNHSATHPCNWSKYLEPRQGATLQSYAGMPSQAFDQNASRRASQWLLPHALHLVGAGIVVGAHEEVSENAWSDRNKIPGWRLDPRRRFSFQIGLTPFLTVYETDNKSAARFVVVRCHSRGRDRWDVANKRLEKACLLARDLLGRGTEFGCGDTGLRKRHEALLRFRGRWKPELGPHRLVGAIKALQPSPVIAYGAASLYARQDILTRIRSNWRLRRRCNSRANQCQAEFLDVHAPFPAMSMLNSAACL